MKRTIRFPWTMVIYTSLTAVGLSALAQNTGFYVKADVGGNITKDADLKEFFGPVAPGTKVKFDS